MATLTPPTLEIRPVSLGKRSRPRHTAVVLLVEDDFGDQILIQEALQAAPTPKRIQIVGDGDEALRYLHRLGPYADPGLSPRPDLILMDLNMPRLGGRELAAKLKSDARFRPIPLVALTTSDRDEDIAYCYSVGVNSYVQKPTDFDLLQQVLYQVDQYWLETSQRAPRMP